MDLLKKLLLGAILLLTSCSVKKETTKERVIHVTEKQGLIKSDIRQTDSKIIERIFIPSSTEIKLDNVCDSLGVSSTVNQKVNFGNVGAFIRSEGNGLLISIKELDSLRSSNTFLREKLISKDSLVNKLRITDFSIQKEKKTLFKWSKHTYVFLAWGIISTLLHFNKGSIFKR